jgi:hypothetical protein
MFKIDLDRLQRDELTYLRRCINNTLDTFYMDLDVTIRIEKFRIRWCKNGKPHRDNDKPAVIWYNGSIYWYKNGVHHRDNDQPAVIFIDGSKYWCKNGEWHRDNDQPAVIQSDGTKRWYKNGEKYEPKSMQ